MSSSHFQWQAISPSTSGSYNPPCLDSINAVHHELHGLDCALTPYTYQTDQFAHTFDLEALALQYSCTIPHDYPLWNAQVDRLSAQNYRPQYFPHNSPETFTSSATPLPYDYPSWSTRVDGAPSTPSTDNSPAPSTPSDTSPPSLQNTIQFKAGSSQVPAMSMNMDYFVPGQIPHHHGQGYGNTSYFAFPLGSYLAEGVSSLIPNRMRTPYVSTPSP